jgi:hypothetical protein
MRGTSSSDDKLADDLGNAIEGTRISGRRSDFSTAGKSAPGHLGLLQQYLPQAVVSRCSNRVYRGLAYSITSSAMASKPGGKVRPNVFAVFRLIGATGAEQLVVGTKAL